MCAELPEALHLKREVDAVLSARRNEAEEASLSASLADKEVAGALRTVIQGCTRPLALRLAAR